MKAIREARFPGNSILVSKIIGDEPELREGRLSIDKVDFDVYTVEQEPVVAHHTPCMWTCEDDLLECNYKYIVVNDGSMTQYEYKESLMRVYWSYSPYVLTCCWYSSASSRKREYLGLVIPKKPATNSPAVSSPLHTEEPTDFIVFHVFSGRDSLELLFLNVGKSPFLSVS